jgi:hypothetical protein
MSNENNNNQESLVFETFDKAAEYVSVSFDAYIAKNNINIPEWAKAKIGIAGHIDSGIKIKAAFDKGDDTAVVSEVGAVIAGFIAGSIATTTLIAFGTPVLVTAGLAVGLGTLASGDTIKEEITDIHNYLKNDATDDANLGAKKLGLEVESFLEGFSNTILNTLLDNNTTHANFAESDLQTLQTQINPEKENSTSQDNSDKKAPVFPITPDKETPIFLDSFEKGILDGLLGLTDTLDGILDELEDLLGELEDSLDKAIDYISIDPLAFDLDGDGIQTSSLDNHINFDHNNNGVKTNTAWLSGNDAWLTLDKNKNGVIDNGAELFGDNTIKQDGTTAKDGIDALKDLDDNQDGIINNQDIQFANLKLWQDKNQDGISQQTELKTLSELGIKSIDLTRTGINKDLQDAIQSDGLTFTKTDGTLGEVAELDLNQNEFFSKFTADGDFNTKEFNLKGTGLVRDLAGATSEDKILNQLVQKLKSSSEVKDFSQQIDDVLIQWSKTGVKQSIFNADFTKDGTTQSHNGKLVRFDIDNGLRQKLAVLETMTAKNLSNSQTWQKTLESTDQGDVLVYSLRSRNSINSAEQFENAYNQLKSYHFDQAIQQTLLQPLINSLELGITDNKININFDNLEQLMVDDFAQNAQNTIQLLTTFNNIYGDKLNEYGFDFYQILKASNYLFKQLDNQQIDDLLTSDSLIFAKAGEELNINSDHLTIAIGTNTNDVINGDKYEANNINSLAGDDIIKGGYYNDTLIGGKGDDVIDGGYGDDNYIFNKGDGTLKILDNDGHDKLIFGKDINKKDINIIQKLDGFIHITIANTTDEIIFKQVSSERHLAINTIEFADGSSIDSKTIFDSQYIGTINNDTITGNRYEANNINSLAGDDIIKGGYYNDTLIGGKGDDVIDGGYGDDNYIFNKGDGTLKILDNDGHDKLIFGKDINKKDINIIQKLDGFIHITIANTTDEIIFKQVSSERHLAIDTIEFADGSSIDSKTIFDSQYIGTINNDTITGNRYEANNINSLAGDDIIKGGYYNDTLIGGKGDDVIDGSWGNDTLIGGKGDDVIDGGYGDDNYIFNKGDGTLEIMDANGYDKLSFGKDITMQDIGLTQDSDNIYLEILSTGDKVQLKSGNNSNQIGVDIVYFDNGSNWSASHLMNASIIDDGQQVL